MQVKDELEQRLARLTAASELTQQRVVCLEAQLQQVSA